MSQSNWVHLEGCNIIKVTEKAVLLEWDDEQHWVPTSQISDAETLEAGDQGVTVSVTEWIAQQRGLDHP